MSDEENSIFNNCSNLRKEYFIMLKRQTANLHTVRFFPIFLAATLAVMIDSVQLLIDETVVGNLFDDVAFGAINLLEPYLLLEEFFSYLICVGGTALIVRARGGGGGGESLMRCRSCSTIA